MVDAAFIDALIAAAGADAVQTGDAVPPRHRTDWSGVTPVQPVALVRPRSTDAVAAVLRVCSEFRVPVVPQGGRTGLVGGGISQGPHIHQVLFRHWFALTG